jgi:hypothetical protein
MTERIQHQDPKACQHYYDRGKAAYINAERLLRSLIDTEEKGRNIYVL